MEPSSQQQPPQPSQEAMALGLPQGYPLKREHLHDVDPLPRQMQDTLDRIMLGEGQPPAVPLRRPIWAGPDDGGPAWA
jgi:hypothetical protein